MSTHVSSTVEATASPNAFQQFWARFRRQKPAVVALVFLLVLVLIALAAPALAPFDPAATNPARRLEGPSAEFLLGTDDLGRDMLSRHIFAARVSLYAALIAVGVALSVSLPVGLASGYFGGRLDTIIQRANDGLMSFPGLILAIAIIGILGTGLTNAMVAIGISYIPFFIRIIRGATMAVREEVYIEAAHQIGSSHSRIIVRHVLPNILSPLIVQTTLALGLAILSEAALSFLGLGIPPPAASWGGMLDRAFTFMYTTPFNVVTPGIAIMLVVLSFNVLGDGIRDSFGRQVRTAD